MLAILGFIFALVGLLGLVGLIGLPLVASILLLVGGVVLVAYSRGLFTRL